MLAVAAALVLGLVAARPGPADDNDRRLEALKSRIETLEKAMRRDTDRRDSEAAALRRAEEAVAQSAGALEATRRELAAVRKRQAGLESRREALARNLAADADALADELRAAWLAGSQPRLKVVLSQGDPDRLGRMLAWYGYLARDRAGRMADLTQRLEALADATRELGVETDKLAALEARQARDVEAHDAARRKRATQLASLVSGLAGRGEEVERLRAEAAALERVIEELRAAVVDLPMPADGEPFGRQLGRLAWPASGSLLRTFGERRGGGPASNGILMSVPRGTEVRAVWRGRVAYADWLPGLGLLLILEHGDGYLSLYGHNEVLLRGVGDWVQAGEVVAHAGDSGGRDSAALYLEIRKNGKPEDPQRWFSTRLGRAR